MAVICYSLLKKVPLTFSRQSTHQNSAPFRVGDGSVSFPLQEGIRLVRCLAPATPTACLTVGLPKMQPFRRCYELTTFHDKYYLTDLGPPPIPAAQHPRRAHVRNSRPGRSPFGPSLSALFGLLLFTILQVFAYADHISQS